MRFKQVLEVLSKYISTQTKIGLEEIYWIEDIDLEHRPAPYLVSMRKFWKLSDSILPFFPWLKIIEVNKTKVQGIVYTAKDKKQQLIFFKGDRIYQQNKILDTRHYMGKNPGYAAFVVEPKTGKIYVFEHVEETMHHNSIVDGYAVESAGMIKILDGKLQALSFYSGHYKNTLLSMKQFFSRLPIQILLSLQSFVCRTNINHFFSPSLVINTLIMVLCERKLLAIDIEAFLRQLTFHKNFPGFSPKERKTDGILYGTRSLSRLLASSGPDLVKLLAEIDYLSPSMDIRPFQKDYPLALTKTDFAQINGSEVLKIILTQILQDLKREPMRLSFDAYALACNHFKIGDVVIQILTAYFKKSLVNIRYMDIASLKISEDSRSLLQSASLFPELKIFKRNRELLSNHPSLGQLIDEKIKHFESAPHLEPSSMQGRFFPAADASNDMLEKEKNIHRSHL